jgi:SAM-dependent methyltransferase
LLAAALDGLASLPRVSEGELLRGKDVLHFAPERQLSDRVRLAARRYVTADFGRGDCDILLDISHMPAVADASFDTVIVCDVLEHVPDDASAFLELNRILRPGGTAVLTVPQADPPATTDEDPMVSTEKDREIRFGQKDHVRMYGDDFLARLEQPGFRVVTITEADFAIEKRTRHVLSPPEPNPSPLATNHRRIYFASKPG